jgi:VWFA-related protein
MPPGRVLLVALVCAAGLVVSAQQPSGVSVRIASPADDSYVSGPVRLVAVVEPASAVRQVREVVFFADGRKVCTLTRMPFECDWDAGDRIVEHAVRVRADIASGGNVVATVHTRGVSFEEAVDVDAVQLTAVVTDGSGRFVKGLTRDDFKVYDNGRLQTITAFQSENIGLELVTAIDVSSSMRPAMPRVKESAKQFLAALRDDDYVTLLAFNDVVFTAGARTKDKAARSLAIDRLSAWGGTSLYDVVVDGLRRLARQTGRRSMVIFSDGDDQSSHATVQAAFAHAEGSDATIYTIGQGRAVTTRQLQSVLNRFATISGGRSFFTEDLERLDGYFNEILEDLSNQYLISYTCPDSERDGQWHSVRVEAKDGKYSVRARNGYRAARN